MPPTGKTFPVNDISPVIATSGLTGLFSAKEMSAVTIVTPALGPSFGVAEKIKINLKIQIIQAHGKKISNLLREHANADVSFPKIDLFRQLSL